MRNDQSRRALREEFEKYHEYWSDELGALLEVDSEYFSLYDKLLRVTLRRNNLSPLEQELIHVAVAGQVTYLNRAALKHHIKRADALGATEAEIVETLQLASAL